MEKEVIFSQSVKGYLSNLVEVLFEEKYFGFPEDAKEYVSNIVRFVENDDFNLIKQTPINFRFYGNYYIKYKANQQTTWYIFFDAKDNKYLVNYIINNHSPEFLKLF